MRATEIIRGILDLIDQVECAQQSKQEPVITVVEPTEEPIQTGVDSNRFKQIFDMLSDHQPQMYDNSPAEVIAGIESVTTNAGGGLNGPKNPADIRADSVSMYPNYLHKPGA
jgi:hypothetical protein